MSRLHAACCKMLAAGQPVSDRPRPPGADAGNARRSSRQPAHGCCSGALPSAALGVRNRLAHLPCQRRRKHKPASTPRCPVAAGPIPSIASCFPAAAMAQVEGRGTVAMEHLVYVGGGGGGLVVTCLAPVGQLASS